MNKKHCDGPECEEVKTENQTDIISLKYSPWYELVRDGFVTLHFHSVECIQKWATVNQNA